MRFALSLLLLVPAVAAAQPPIVSEPGVTVAIPPLISQEDSPPPLDAVPDADTLEGELRDIEAQIDLLSQGLADPGAATAWPELDSVAALPPIRTVVHPPDRSVTVITTTLRHTTLQLPPDESIVDFVVGDAFYFDLRGGDNVAYVKALDDDRRTQVTLVTNQDHAYSFDVFSTTRYRPDEVLTVQWTPEDDSRPGGPPGVRSSRGGLRPEPVELTFASSTLIDDYRERIAEAEADAFRIRQDGAAEEAQVRSLGLQRFEEFFGSYPARVQHRYRLSAEIRAPPLFVTQIWTDGQFTYLRSRSQESPALYSLSGEQASEPVLVNVDLKPDGLYIVDHVLGAGYAQLQGVRGDWFLWDVPPVGMLSELPLPRGEEGPEWIRTRASLPWFKRHPRLFATLVSAGLGTYIVFQALR